jgi:hypothetical protein
MTLRMLIGGVIGGGSALLPTASSWAARAEPARSPATRFISTVYGTVVGALLASSVY